MNPIYKFTLNGADAKPIYGEDLAKVFEKESGEEFFRAKLNNPLTFIKDDYDSIMAEAFDYEHSVVVYISYDRGANWSEYWRGKFWRTDCKINEDDKVIEVTPSVDDEYSDVLNGMEKEYDLIPLAPELEEVLLDKRGVIQIYTPGESVVGCFLSGMWWEEQCSPQEDVHALCETGDNKPNFKKLMTVRFAKITNRSDISGSFCFKFVNVLKSYQSEADGYIFKYIYDINEPLTQDWQIVRASDNVIMWRFRDALTVPHDRSPITLTPVAGSGATGDVIIEFVDADILGRYICDVNSIFAQPTYELPSDDFVFNNRNYHRVMVYENDDAISVSDRLTSTPTKWGIFQPRSYYLEPESVSGEEYFPIARTYWARYSLWFNFLEIDHATEEASRKQIKLKNAYPIYSAIKVLLGQIAPSITHDGDTTYSAFLYGQNPLTSDTIYWFITPKSNILVGEYDQPAQKAPCTLREILDMLRDCFRCYWFIDNGKFRIEHITYFMWGGTYTPGPPSVQRDLTTEKVSRNGKEWSYCTSKYSFDKAQMPERYEFGWTDKATQYFDGEPIDILSNYVDKGNIQKISVQSFSSDVDYLMLEPNGASSDGFVLLGAVTPPQENLFELKRTSRSDDHFLQKDGTFVGNNSSFWIDIFEVDDRNTLEVKCQQTSNNAYANVVAYDSNGDFLQWFKISNTGTVVTMTITLPSGAKTIAVQGSINQTPKVSIVASANHALIATGASVVLPGYSVTGFIPVNGKNIRSSGHSPFQQNIYVSYCVYDSNHTSIRFGRGRTYYYETGDAYVKFTCDTSDVRAYYFYYILPYYNYAVGSNDHYLQNGLAAFVYLEQFYLYDLPAYNYAIGNNQGTALGVRKTKTQTLNFPCILDANLVNLIKTNMGNGKIEKISINLSSRNAEATLMYDTE